MRIVSLIASATEIVWALGCEHHLVGRSHECDFPPAIRSLPVCTAPRFNIEGSSLEIDQRVKEALAQERSVYRVDGERLRALRPDVILTQSQCEVCAVSLREVEQTLCAWREGQPRVVTLVSEGLHEVWDDMHKVAQVLHLPERGHEVVAGLHRRVEAITRQARRCQPAPRVACLEWLAPLMAAGNWMPELVERAGGINLLGTAGHHSPWVSWEQLCHAAPEVILVLPCGFDLARTRREMPALTGHPSWPTLPAVRLGRVFLLDGNQYFNRPGPRLVDSLEILAEILHPEQFSFGHRGVGWEPL